MEEIQPPAKFTDAKPVVVPALKFQRDAGTSWARALNPAQIADLVDLAGELSVIFPVVKERRVTEKQFLKKLESLGQLSAANDKLLRLVGHTSGLVTLYLIWWSYAYVANYTRVTMMSGVDDTMAAREETARRMGISVSALTERLARRDVSFMVNLFLSRLAAEAEGEIAWKTAQEALLGGARAMDLYYRHVRTAEDGGERGGALDPFNLSEGELMAEVSRLRKLGAKKQEDWQLPAPEEEDEPAEQD